MKRYDLRKIMNRAWSLFRKGGVSFGEALHRAWLSDKSKEENARRIEVAKAEAGIEEEIDTWKGWSDKGFEVIHGSKAVLGVDLIYASKGDGAVYKARFFGASQVRSIEVA